MCGINFILDKAGQASDAPIRRMLSSLHHRGPDSQHFTSHILQNQKIYLGANRLKIVEKSDLADQPFYSEDQSYALLFNGEIYNFFDLKNELLNHNVRFKSNSDTEVLLYWMKLFGKSRIGELEGMFSFVFVDLENQEILVGRDRFGMKPLYYAENSKYLIVSSEIRGILASGLVEKELNEDQIPHYFHFRYPQPPGTFYEQIFHVPPACYLEVKKGTISEPMTYYKPEYEQKNVSVDEFRELLFDGVQKHLYAKSGIGLMLSGGVDSSLLLALSLQSGVSLPCYSIFSANKSQEQQFAEKLTKKHHIEHRVMEYDQSILDVFPEYIEKLDQPISDSAGLLTYQLSKVASGDVKVLFSGAGADELFAGYKRHLAFRKYLENKKSSLFLKNYFWPITRRFMSKGINQYFNGVEKNAGRTYMNFIASHFREFQSEFPFEKEFKNSVEDPLTDSFIEDRVNYLPGDVLAISDVASMAASIEMRMPYLDNHVYDAVNRCEGNYLMEKGPKWILKELLQEYAGKSMVVSQKAGFGLPINRWFSENKNSYIWKLFDNKNSIIFNFVRHQFFKDLIHSHQNSKQDHSQELWSILTLAHWLQKEFD